jgi:hypothetical protein
VEGDTEGDVVGNGVLDPCLSRTAVRPFELDVDVIIVMFGSEGCESRRRGRVSCPSSLMLP